MQKDELVTLINSSIIDIDNNNLGSAKQKLHIAIERLCSPPPIDKPPLDKP